MRAAYEAILARVERPGRYLGNERGMIRKDTASVTVRFGLAFPDVYEIAQSHPGLQILYDLLNRRPDTYAERVYAPWFDLEAELRAAKLPLVTLETATPLRDLDVLGFTLQYELTYTNVLAMLDLGGIPLHSADRGPEDPLVIAGGPCAFNPEPLADFLDAVVLGDGEEVIHDICDRVAAWDGANRPDLLAELARVRGVYIPAFFSPRYGSKGQLVSIEPLRPGYDRVEKRVVADLNTIPLQQSFIVPTVPIVHDRPSLEVMRGCVKGCRFCQAGYIYRPLRERDPRRVLTQAESAVRQTGQDEVSLLSLSTGDYSCVNPLLTELMNRLAAQRIAVSLPSTRVDALAPTLLEQIKRVRKTGFTLAPEVGTQRLRDVIQKAYDEAELIEASAQISALGWRALKLYFMLGLPSETEDDLLGIVELTHKVASAGNFRTEVTASVSNFVPKAHTPFQWAPQISVREIEARQELLRRELRKRNLRFRWHDARLSWIEGIFSRGDRRTGNILLAAYRQGCRFDGWSDHSRADLWEAALRDTGTDPSAHLRRRLLDEVLPWDHLSCGVTKDFLQRELAGAFERTLTPDCSVSRCTYCGACDFTTVRNIDYHLTGAKAAEHRGQAIAHWAGDVVGTTDEGGWEPRSWQKLHTKEPAALATSLSERHIAAHADAPSSRRQSAPGPTRGLGTAEAWLSADGESIRPPVRDGTAPAIARIRLQYTKLRSARYIGALELTNLFYRAARRARVPVAFSQGFHPLPRFAFGPALPLGVESACELIDIDLTDNLPANAVTNALGNEMPDGIEIRGATSIPLSTPSVTSQIVAFQYSVDVRIGAMSDARARVQAQVAAFWAQDAFPIEKHGRNGPRRVDARKFVSHLALTDRALDMTVAFGAGGTLKPSDLLAAVLGIDSTTARALPVRKIATVFHDRVESAPVSASGG